MPLEDRARFEAHLAICDGCVTYVDADAPGHRDGARAARRMTSRRPPRRPARGLPRVEARRADLRKPEPRVTPSAPPRCNEARTGQRAMNAETTPRLGTLPVAFPATVAALHRVAEQVVAPARKPDNEIALTATPGGFGTPVFPYGGVDHQVRVDGAELVHRAGDEERRAPLTTLETHGARRRARARGPLGDTPLDVDPDAAARLADWYAFGDAVLARARGATAAPIPLARALRHRDRARTRLNYGFSPGDEQHAEPYAYVGPWTAPPAGRAVERDRLPRRRADLRRAAGGARPARRRARVLHDPQGGARMSVQWHRVLAADELPDGRVTTVAAGHKSVALVHYDGQFSALDNHCPHQGGPLGEGSIENGLLRCPWHGFDYCPLDGTSPGFDDEATTYPLEIRDGEVFVGVAGRDARRDRHRPDGRDDGQLGRRARLRHGRALQPRPRRRAAPPGGGRAAHLHRHPPRGRRGVRRVRLRQAHRPPRRLPDDRRPRRHQPAHRAVGREGRPRAGPRAHRPGQHAGARPRRVPGGRPRGRVRLRRRVEPARAARLQPGRADEPRLQERAAAARRRAPDLPRRGPDAAGARGRGGRRAGRPRVAVDDLAARGVDRGRAAAAARLEAAGDHRRPRRPLPHARGDRARRAARRAGDHDVQGQGPDRRRPPAGRRRARPQRDAGGELGDERGRPAARARRVVLQPHRHLRRPPDHPGRLRPDAARQVPRRRRARVGRGRRRGRAPARRAARPARDRRPGRAARRALGDLAGGEGQPRRRRSRRTASTPRRCSRRWSARSPTTP